MTTDSSTSSIISGISSLLLTLPDPNEPIARTALQHPHTAPIIFSYVNRGRKELLALPCVASWLTIEGEEAHWQRLFREQWPAKWVEEAETTIAAGGTSWKQQYQRRHEETRAEVVEPTNSSMAFATHVGMLWQAWKYGDIMWEEGKGGIMSEAHSRMILFNGHAFTFHHGDVEATGEEGSGDIVCLERSCWLERYYSPKGFFTVAEVLKIVCYRYSVPQPSSISVAWRIYRGLKPVHDEWGAVVGWRVRERV